MLITRIELQNIKSYEGATVQFAPGTNAICGSNGAGKSTILEAIGFALFDFNPFHKQQDMVREGEKRGEITIGIVANDGRAYDVTRGFGSSTRYAVHDSELGLELVQGKSDVQQWLCQYLGVPEAVNLPTLFSDAIGVPQGLLAAVFHEGRPERHAKFDRLLRVDEYGSAKANLLDTARHLKDRLNELRNRITALETRTLELPEVVQAIDDLQRGIAADESERARLESEIEAQIAGVERFEAARERLRQIDNTLALLEGRLDSGRRQLDDARKGLVTAQRAADDLEASAAGHEHYLEAGALLRQLEDDRARRDELREARASTEKTLAQVESRLESARARLERIAAAETEMARLAPAVEEQGALEEELREHEARASQLDHCQRSIEEVQAQLDNARARAEQTAGEIADVARLQPAADRAGELQSRLAAAMDLIGRTRARLEQARDSRQAVAGGDCPFLGEPCKNIAEGMSLTDHFDRLIGELSAELKDTQSLRDEIQAELRVAQEATAHIARLPGLERNRELFETQIAEADTRLHDLKSQAETLADARERATQIRSRLAELGDPRSLYAGARARAAGREEVETSLTGDEDARRVLTDRLAELAETASAFEGLDLQIETAREAQARHSADHEIHLRSQALAGTLPEWQDRLLAAESALTLTQEQLEAARVDRQTAAAGYDADAHAAANQALADSRSAAASCAQRLQMRRESLDRAVKRRDELVTLQAELEVARRQYGADDELREFVQFARDVIGEAGPLVTRALVAAISREAAAIFSEIVNDHSLHLAWTEDYEILVELGGNVRSFPQLSGGEQMAAAIAVRLALLREVSSLDIAFFDEPTANLDETRREMLADQIVKISGFSQIFVISHDDTFERATDHMIRVYKEDGVSRVETM